MSFGRFLHGTMRQFERPDWRSLEMLLGSHELCAQFMWMWEIVLEDGTSLQVYKHSWTRRHLHLAQDARTFYWAAENSYGRGDPYVWISEVFDGWERLKPTASELAALRRVLDLARSGDGSAVGLESPDPTAGSVADACVAGAYRTGRPVSKGTDGF